jgi:hypothetical protein
MNQDTLDLLHEKKKQEDEMWLKNLLIGDRLGNLYINVDTTKTEFKFRLSEVD